MDYLEEIYKETNKNQVMLRQIIMELNLLKMDRIIDEQAAIQKGLEDIAREINSKTEAL